MLRREALYLLSLRESDITSLRKMVPDGAIAFPFDGPAAGCPSSSAFRQSWPTSNHRSPSKYLKAVGEYEISLNMC
jgi:hypothetical protein